MSSATNTPNKIIGEFNSFQTLTSETGGLILQKTLLNKNPSIAEAVRYENELYFADYNRIEGVRKVIGAGSVPYSLILEWVDGKPLTEWMREEHSLLEKLDLAIAISGIVVRLHNEGIIHKNLCPNHILVNESNVPCIIDLSLATIVIAKSESHNSIRENGNPDFISPEQTGRINRLVDHRTDLYSLGGVLYYLFSHEFPFPGDDLLEKIHAQIAQNPVPLNELLESFPNQLSHIVSRLMSKNPEDRYQSAYGLKYDLENCRIQLKDTNEIEEFPLQGQDFRGELVFSNRLFGRESELNDLKNIFESCAKGQKQLLTVTGFSGTGKTSLVHQLYEPVFKARGMLLSGKFEKFQRDIPYFGFQQLFLEFVQNIQSLDQGEVEAWKENIRNATFPIGKVLSQVQPQLDLFVGEQPSLPELNGPEAQNRFNYAILSFLRSLTSPGSPLVLFLDDVQWADVSSIQLLKVLLTQRELKNVLVIISYRDTEIPASHSVAALIQDLQEHDIPVSDIHLNSLDQEAVNEMLSEVLQLSEKDNKELTEIVYKKSQGNALFIHQFLKSARQENVLKFDFEKRSWVWNYDEMVKLNVDGDVEELLLGFIDKLPEATIKMLSFASCLGGVFTLSTLAHLYGASEAEVRKILHPAMVHGLLLESRKKLLFGHDKIQQILYEKVPDSDRAVYHNKIAKYLDNSASSDNRIFDRVYHWNKCLELVNDELGRLNISEINFKAGTRAKLSVAFEEAFNYFGNALQLLPENHWKTHYQFSLDLYSSAAETAYLLGKHELSEKYVGSVISNAQSVEDKSKSIIYRIRAYTAENKLIEAMETGFDLLDELGVKLPRHPGKINIGVALVRTRFLLNGKSHDDIHNLPAMSDKRILIVMDVIYSMLAPAYFAMPDFLPVGVFKMIALSLKYGLGPITPYAFLGYGYIYSAFLGNIKAGTKYGNIGFSLHKKLDTRAMSASFHGIYHALTNHWIMHLPDTIQGLKEGYQVGLETGDIEYTSYLAHNIIYHSLYSGKNLPEILDEGSALLKQVESFNIEMVLYRIRIFLQSIHDLIELPAEPGVLDGEFARESLNKYKPEKQNHILFHNLYLQKMLVALIYGKNENAWEYVQEIELYNNSVQGSALFPLLHYYRPLAITAVYHKHPEKAAYFRRILNKDLKKLRLYMKFSPGNYSQKYWLVMAEVAKISNDEDGAQKYYFKALREARQSKLVIDEAMCWERASNFYHSQEQDQVAEFYINNAYMAYKKWGANGKVAAMHLEYPQLDSNEYVVIERESNENLDLATVVKTYNAITGEIVMSNLLKKLMQIMVENAGAQRGVLIRENKGHRYIMAVMDKDDGEAEVLLNEPLSTSQRLSKTIVNYTANSEKYLVLDNAMSTRPYNTDNYIRENNVKSVICMPIMEKGKLFGYLYLENNLVSGAFTKARISLLKILSAQAAVSLENAELYEGMTHLNQQLKSEILEKETAQEALLENEKRLEEYNQTLEEKVEERTKEISEQRDLIEHEKQKSDNLLLNILPEETADELKKFGKAEPRRYNSVTVLFTDFVSFSKISETVNPDVLVKEIHYYYSAFDNIISKYKLEKIKTIGDSYMCAAGLPVEISDHAYRAVSAALDIQKFIEDEKEKRMQAGEMYFDIRIGLHSGSVVAGIVGIRKFAYDIWGDTVNYASRMEGASVPGKINISGSTYQLVNNTFECTYRGKIEVKSKGEIDMYFVENAKG